MVLSFLDVQADQAKKVGCLLFYDALVQDGLADCVGWQQVKLRNEMPRDELGQAALIAIRKGAKRSLVALLDAGADVNHVSPDRPFCPLIEESIFGDREALFYTLLSHPEVNLNKGDCEGRTSLHWAVKKGDMCFVAALLRHQASMRMLWYRAIQFMPEDIRKQVFSFLGDAVQVDARDLRGAPLACALDCSVHPSFGPFEQSNYWCIAKMLAMFPRSFNSVGSDAYADDLKRVVFRCEAEGDFSTPHAIFRLKEDAVKRAFFSDGLSVLFLHDNVFSLLLAAHHNGCLDDLMVKVASSCLRRYGDVSYNMRVVLLAHHMSTRYKMLSDKGKKELKGSALFGESESPYVHLAKWFSGEVCDFRIIHRELDRLTASFQAHPLPNACASWAASVRAVYVRALLWLSSVRVAAVQAEALSSSCFAKAGVLLASQESLGGGAGFSDVSSRLPR